MPNTDDRVNLFAENISPSLLLRILKKHWRILLGIMVMLVVLIIIPPSTADDGNGGRIRELKSEIPGLAIVFGAVAATHGLELFILPPLAWIIRRYLGWREKHRPLHPAMGAAPDGMSLDQTDKIFPSWRKAIYWFSEAAWLYALYGIYLGIRAGVLPQGGSESHLFSALSTSWIGQLWMYPVVVTIPLFYVEWFFTLSPRFEEARKQAHKAYSSQQRGRTWLVFAGAIAVTELAALIT